MSLSGLPAREVERYVTRAELAEVMGVSVDTVDRMREQGMPYVVWGKRCVRLKPSVALAWARARGTLAA